MVGALKLAAHKSFRLKHFAGEGFSPRMAPTARGLKPAPTGIGVDT